MTPLRCLFCQILEGEVAADVVAESPHSLAFRDIDPMAPSHVLVVPRRHVEHLGALGGYAAELADVVWLATRVAADEGLDQGYRLVANTGAMAGQTVFHAHLHLLGGREMRWPPG